MNPNRTTFETLLTELIIVILVKLPVESLFRCKSVCKKWKSLISSDQLFINLKYAHHTLICNTFEYGQPTLISCPLYDVLFKKSINNAIQLENPLQETWPQRVRIVGSCNGLVCILVEDDNTLIIYNTSTRTTSSILPGSEQRLGGSYGFGYDETTHDYKVVKIWRCHRTWPYWGTMIYSLKPGSWKEIGRFPCLEPSIDGKFLNGAIHWATGDCWGSWRIVSLDLGKETYGEVLQPEYEYVEGSKRLTLGVLGEFLCVLCDYCDSRVVDVWVMKVYGVKDSWTKLACIPYPTDIWRDQILAPLCISNDGKVLLQVGLKLFVYDSKDSSSTMIDNFDGCRQACIVVESLVSPFPPLGLTDNNDDEN